MRTKSSGGKLSVNIMSNNVIDYGEKFAELIPIIQSGTATDKQLKMFEKLRQWMLNEIK